MENAHVANEICRPASNGPITPPALPARPRPRGRAMAAAILLLMITGGIWSCSASSPLVLSNADGSHQLTYDCDDIHPHATSPEDLEVIGFAFEAVMEELMDDDRLDQLEEFAAMAGAGDLYGLERLVVKHRCAAGSAATDESGGDQSRDGR